MSARCTMSLVTAGVTARTKWAVSAAPVRTVSRGIAVRLWMTCVHRIPAVVSGSVARMFCPGRIRVPAILDMEVRNSYHDDVMTWNRFSNYWPFVRGIYLSPPPVTGRFPSQRASYAKRVIILSHLLVWTNNQVAGDLTKHNADVMSPFSPFSDHMDHLEQRTQRYRWRRTLLLLSIWRHRRGHFRWPLWVRHPDCHGVPRGRVTDALVRPWWWPSGALCTRGRPLLSRWSTGRQHMRDLWSSISTWEPYVLLPKSTSKA